MNINDDMKLSAWILDASEGVIGKMIGDDSDSLTPLERLLYCLFISDYCMRNAGDMANAPVLYPRL